MDITIKRNMAALATEIKLWEGYLQKVKHAYKYMYTLLKCHHVSN